MDNSLDFYNDKKYTLDELKEGMIVRATQLSDILDIYIILVNAKLVKDKLGIGTFEGEIDLISEEKVSIEKDNSVLIYNSSFDKEEYCEYE